MGLIYPSGDMTEIPIYLPDDNNGDGGKGPKKGGDWKLFVILCVMALITFWGITTLLQWLNDPFKSPSLEEVLKNQWKWAQSITLTEAQKEERAWIRMVEDMTRFAEQLPGYEPPDPRDPSGACGGVVTSAGSGMVLKGAPFLWRRVDE